MTDSENILSRLRDMKPALQSWKINRMRVFGSVMRGEAKHDSDVDLIVDFQEKPGLLEFVGIKQDMEEILHRKVHLFTEQSISKYIRAKVLEEAKDV